MRPHHRISVFVLLLLCGCDMHDPAKQKSESESEQQWARESQLLEDPAIARPELVRRLRVAVSMRDGLLVVKSQRRFHGGDTCGGGVTCLDALRARGAEPLSPSKQKEVSAKRSP
jgi:hypothetical protein